MWRAVYYISGATCLCLLWESDRVRHRGGLQLPMVFGILWALFLLFAVECLFGFCKAFFHELFRASQK
jgi:hypothetical protein